MNESKNEFEMNKKNIKILMQYAFRLILILIIIAWALVNIDDVMSLLGKFADIISPLVMGGILAFIVDVIMRPLEKAWTRAFASKHEKLKRPICLIASTLIVIGIIFMVLFMMLPSLRESADVFIKNLPTYAYRIEGWWQSLVDFATNYNIVLPEVNVDPDVVLDRMATFINEKGSGILSVTVGAASSLLSGIFDMVLAIVFAIYLLAQKEVVSQELTRLVSAICPKTVAQRILSIASLTEQTFVNFVTGQLVEAVIIGTLCFIGMSILRIPYAGAVATLVATTALIPVVGAWLGGGLGGLIILLTEPIKALWFIIFLVTLQQVEGNLIYPKVVGKSVGLPGILVLIAVTVGGGAFGIWGMLFGVPVCAVLYSLYQEFMEGEELIF